MAKPINVVIKGDYTDRDINRAISDLNRLKTQGNDTRTGMGALARSLKSVLGPAMIGAAAAAGTMAIAIGVDAVKAALDEEAASAKLARTLKNLGFEQATTSVEAFIDATQRSTGVADDQLRPAFDRLVRSTEDVNEAQALMRLALDISAGSGKSLQQTVEALSRASDGNTTALSRLGTGLDKATLKTGDMDIITAKLAQRFEGFAAEAATTMRGKIDKLAVAFDELKEAFGVGFLEGLEEATGGTDDLNEGIRALEPTVKFVGGSIGQFLVTISAAFIQLSEAAKAVKAGDFSGALQILAADTKTFVRGFNDFDDAVKNFGGGTFLADGLVRANEHMARLDLMTGKAKGGIDELRRSGSSAGSAAEEMAIKWKQAAASVTADVEGLKVTMGGGGQVIAGALVDEFQSRLGAFKAVVDAQVGIIRQAQAAIDSYSKSIVDSILGGISISTTDAQGNALTPEQIVTSLFGGIENRTKAVEAIAAIAKKVPEALAQQLITLTSTDPQGAIALANYLANNPAQTEQLTANYNALSTFTKTALGDPMGVAFAQVGDESATKMIEDAKKKIDESAAEFQRFVRSKLKTRITVEVEYVAVNVVAGARMEARADGGPVARDQAYLVGEQGPEVFVPGRAGVIVPNDALGASGSAIGGGGNTYQITVQTGVGDPRQIGEQVVSYIKRFEAASGPVFARA